MADKGMVRDCRNAMANEGPRADEWNDKPHRLVYDLCNEVVKGRTENAALVQQLRDFASFVAYGDGMSNIRGRSELRNMARDVIKTLEDTND